MKGLTLTQPWATLVARGEKHFETRSWSTPYRGPLAIHAAKSLKPVGGRDGLHELLHQQPFRSLFAIAAGNCADVERAAGELPYGAIVAVCDLDVVYPALATLADIAAGRVGASLEAVLGDYNEGRFAWGLWNMHPLSSPVPYAGARGLWDVPELWHLCCNCGGITPEEAWTYWHRSLDDDVDGWVPARPGETDPMCKCPACGWEHVDDDSNPGFYDGSLAELDLQRVQIEADYADMWAGAGSAA